LNLEVAGFYSMDVPAEFDQQLQSTYSKLISIINEVFSYEILIPKWIVETIWIYQSKPWTTFAQ